MGAVGRSADIVRIVGAVTAIGEIVVSPVLQSARLRENDSVMIAGAVRHGGSNRQDNVVLHVHISAANSGDLSRAPHAAWRPIVCIAGVITYLDVVGQIDVDAATAVIEYQIVFDESRTGIRRISIIVLRMTAVVDDDPVPVARVLAP